MKKVLRVIIFIATMIMMSSVSLAAGEGYDHGKYSGYDVKMGVDVSSHQSSVDWNRAKMDGIEFAYIRLGNRGYASAGNIVLDKKYREYASAANRANLPIGVYFFSQATTIDEAREEAQFVLHNLSGINVALPIAMDFEYASHSNGSPGRLLAANLSAAEQTAICNAFCDVIRANGREAMVYANKNMLTNDLYADQIARNNKIWLAHYTSRTNYTGTYTMWQCSSKAVVNGINGNVDLDFWYVQKQVPKFSGLKMLDDGNWYLFENDKINYDYNDLYYDSTYGWWKIKNGRVEFDYTGLYLSPTYGWWLIGGGAVAFNYNDLWYDKDLGWWKINGGTVDFGFTGLYNSPTLGWWLIGGGSVAFFYDDLWGDPVFGWWKVVGGTVDFGYNGMYESKQYGKWKIAGGAVDFSYYVN